MIHLWRDFLRLWREETYFKWLLLIALLTGFETISKYYSGDVAVHRRNFYLLIAGKSVFNQEYYADTGYLPSAQMIYGPFIVISHYMSWILKMYVFQIPELISHLLNVVLIGILSRKHGPLMIVCYLLTPYALMILLGGGNVEVGMTACMLLGLYLFQNKTFFWAGFFSGLACYKFVLLPCCLALIIFLLIRKNWTTLRSLFLGALLSNLFNFLYFARFPDELLQLAAGGGPPTSWGWKFRIYHPLGEINQLISGFDSWYIEGGIWVWSLLPSIFVAVYGLLKGRATLIDAMAIAYSPVVFMWQGEDKSLMFFVLLLIGLARFQNFFWGQLSLFLASAQFFLIHFRHNIWKFNDLSDLPFHTLGLLEVRYWFLTSFFIYLYLVFSKRINSNGTLEIPLPTGAKV